MSTAALIDEYRHQRLAVSPAEAARLLGICRASIYNGIARGDIRSITIGRSRRIPINELDRLLAVADPSPKPATGGK